MLNQIVIVGRLVRDPELRQTEAGKKVIQKEEKPKKFKWFKRKKEKLTAAAAQNSTKQTKN